MRWSRLGAQLMLHVRTAHLNGTLERYCRLPQPVEWTWPPDPPTSFRSPFDGLLFSVEFRAEPRRASVRKPFSLRRGVSPSSGTSPAPPIGARQIFKKVGQTNSQIGWQQNCARIPRRHRPPNRFRLLDQRNQTVLHCPNKWTVLRYARPRPAPKGPFKLRDAAL